MFSFTKGEKKFLLIAAAVHFIFSQGGMFLGYMLMMAGWEGASSPYINAMTGLGMKMIEFAVLLSFPLYFGGGRSPGPLAILFSFLPGPLSWFAFIINSFLWAFVMLLVVRFVRRVSRRS